MTYNCVSKTAQLYKPRKVNIYNYVVVKETPTALIDWAFHGEKSVATGDRRLSTERPYIGKPKEDEHQPGNKKDVIARTLRHLQPLRKPAQMDLRSP